MSRSFWVAVGAAGGIVAYRRGTRAVERARELGPLGSAQLAAQTTSNLAGKTANGIGRLQDARARRAGRLVLGSAEAVGDDQSGSSGSDAAGPPGSAAPAAPAGTAGAAGAAGGPPRAPPSPPTGSPSTRPPPARRGAPPPA